MRRHDLQVLALAALFVLPAHANADAATGGFGAFKGSVAVRWLDDEGDSRKMQLLEPFNYTDASGGEWNVPKGWKVDGASIPPALWSVIGSPYTGPYRRASVIHDYYCDVKTRGWRATHRMFYEAMRAGGVPEVQAKTMFRAVYEFGPRWVTLKGSGLEEGQTFTAPYTPAYTAHDPAELDVWIVRDDPSIDQIEERVDKLEAIPGPPAAVPAR